jgi:hypothetical protein
MRSYELGVTLSQFLRRHFTTPGLGVQAGS